MKRIDTFFLFIIVAVFSSCSHIDTSKRVLASKANSPDAMMSPIEGEEAFNRLYDLIGEAKKYVHLSIYSWSDAGLDKALEKALGNKARVRVVFHPTLKNSSKVKNIVPKLEALGGEFKISPLNMHEKFTIIDDELLINTSANFSSGAKNKYSENMIFHELSKKNSEAIKLLINDFKNEFSILWNTSKDIVTHGEVNSDRLSDFTKYENIPSSNTDMILYSSSMNWSLKENDPGSSAFKAGKYQTLVKKLYPNTLEQTWTVRDALINAIDSAEHSIYLSLNHFNIRAVSDVLIRAVQRGIDVKLCVDNQEYKIKPNGQEMTPQFVFDWKSLKGDVTPPVRVKYYSHEPSPRNWLLNHHKFILIDYEVPEKTMLFSGSYNLSATAEHNQFDNLVIYKNPVHQNLYKRFYTEFKDLWNLNRVEDRPRKDLLDQFFTLKNNSYPLHVSEAIALTFPEVLELRSKINKLAPGIFSGLYRSKDCTHYDPIKKQYWGCPPVNR